MKAVLILVTGVMLVAACNTVKGVGRDIEAAAETVEDAVTD